jgi:hypothetical protein
MDRFFFQQREKYLGLEHGSMARNLFGIGCHSLKMEIQQNSDQSLSMKAYLHSQIFHSLQSSFELHHLLGEYTCCLGFKQRILYLRFADSHLSRSNQGSFH